MSSRKVHIARLADDPIASKWYDEIKTIPYALKCGRAKAELSTKWMYKLAAEYFFDHMDYFDGSEATLEAAADKFSGHIERCTMGAWTGFDRFHPHMEWTADRKPLWTTLWSKMVISVDKTTFWLQKNYDVGGRDWGTVGYLTIHDNVDAFNAGYMKNVLDLARKQLEIEVEAKRTDFRFALSAYMDRIQAQALKEESERLAAQLAAQTAQYEKMKAGFDSAQAANAALLAKVEAQDVLIQGLNHKMDALIGFFGAFKEAAPRDLLRALIDGSQPLMVTGFYKNPLSAEVPSAITNV